MSVRSLVRNRLRPLAMAGAAGYCRAAGSAARARRRLYDGAAGLRILTLHETRGAWQLDRLHHLVDRLAEGFDFATPEDAAAFDRGDGVRPDGRDALLMTFDDGHADNYDAAVLLHSLGIRAAFFVIPSFVGRSVEEYYAFHEASGVRATRFAPHHRASRGLSRTQLVEMRDMGHTIGGHNYSHRDLGPLTAAADLEYEIGRAVAELEDMLEAPCRHFAWGFGEPQHLSREAAAFLKRRVPHVHSCVGGLNLPRRPRPFLLRHHVNLSWPPAFVAVLLQGAFDRRYAGQWRALDALFPAGSGPAGEPARPAHPAPPRGGPEAASRAGRPTP
ncbi:MAG: polysaccharide deacetylase family protein [Rhodospirillaceae bacterium]|nr:polysaccharide deacetylase family protein [Rhodospirillaceae bacterium]